MAFLPLRRIRMTNHRPSLTYCPVGPETDRLAMKYVYHYFDNAIRRWPPNTLDIEAIKEAFCDSGGLQAFRAMEKGKTVIVDPLMNTNISDPDLFILGTACQCKEYGRRKSTRAMLIDIPTLTDEDDLTYLSKRMQSRKAKAQMLRWAEIYCPDTELGIVLQPRNPLEAKSYYCSMYTPKVRIYGYPIRDFRNAPEDALGNAYVLSFLCDAGIEHVHFLGSSAPPVIFMLAQAAVYKMFDRISFDSLTWNQPAVCKSYKYLHPETLSSLPNNGKGLNRNDNLRTKLDKDPGLFEAALGKLVPPNWAVVKDWLGIFNIRITEMFKDAVLEVALEGGLPNFIKRFDKYTIRQREMMVEALELLEDSKLHGHEYVDRKYRTKIAELYC